MFLLNYMKIRKKPLTELVDVVVSSIWPKQKSQSCRSTKNPAGFTVLIYTEPRLTWKNPRGAALKASEKSLSKTDVHSKKKQNNCQPSPLLIWSLKVSPIQLWCFPPWLQLSHRQKAARSRPSAAVTQSSSAAANGPFLLYKFVAHKCCLPSACSVFSAVPSQSLMLVTSPVQSLQPQIDSSCPNMHQRRRQPLSLLCVSHELSYLFHLCY